MPRLENWEIIYDMFKDCHRLRGETYNDKRAPDGTIATTSRIIEIDFTIKEARTENTIYNLGKAKGTL